jgi:hypothetical protein
MPNAECRKGLRSPQWPAAWSKQPIKSALRPRDRLLQVLPVELDADEVQPERGAGDRRTAQAQKRIHNEADALQAAEWLRSVAGGRPNPVSGPINRTLVTPTASRRIATRVASQLANPERIALELMISHASSPFVQQHFGQTYRDITGVIRGCVCSSDCKSKTASRLDEPVSRIHLAAEDTAVQAIEFLVQRLVRHDK